MWLQEEIDDLKKYYTNIDHLTLDQVVEDDEMEAIANSAVYNLVNQVVAPRKLKRFMTSIRLQYLATDKYTQIIRVNVKRLVTGVYFLCER